MIQSTTRPKSVRFGEYTMNNDRYVDFLKFALHRIVETAILYESEAKSCKNSTNKLFLYFLAGKKRVQHVVLEMIATNNRGKPLPFSEYSSLKQAEDTQQINLACANAEYILKFAHDRAEKDLSLYISLAALEEDINTKKLLITLSKLSKDFIQDVTAGYSKFTLNHIETSQAGPKIKFRKKVQESVASN